MITTDLSTQLCVYTSLRWNLVEPIDLTPVSIKMSEQRSGRTLLNFKFYTYVPLYTVQI